MLAPAGEHAESPAWSAAATELQPADGVPNGGYSRPGEAISSDKT